MRILSFGLLMLAFVVGLLKPIQAEAGSARSTSEAYQIDHPERLTFVYEGGDWLGYANAIRILYAGREISRINWWTHGAMTRKGLSQTLDHIQQRREVFAHLEHMRAVAVATGRRLIFRPDHHLLSILQIELR